MSYPGKVYSSADKTVRGVRIFYLGAGQSCTLIYLSLIATILHNNHYGVLANRGSPSYFYRGAIQ